MDENEQQAPDPLADLDEMLADLTWRDGLGVWCHRAQAEDGGFAYFPRTAGEGLDGRLLAGEEQAAAERAWEERCAEMHAGQTVTLPPDKPLDNAYAKRPDGTLKRGD